MGVNVIKFFSIFYFKGVRGQFNQKKAKNGSTKVFTLFLVKMACNSFKIEDREKIYLIDPHYFFRFWGGHRSNFFKLKPYFRS